MIAERQRGRERKGRLVSAIEHGLGAPRSLGAVLEMAVPLDRRDVRRQPQAQCRIGHLMPDDMHRSQAERPGVVLLGERVGGALRVRRQPESRDQACQRLFIRLVHLAERIDVAHGDTDELGNSAEIVEPAHRPAVAGSRKNAAQAGASFVSATTGPEQ